MASEVSIDASGLPVASSAGAYYAAGMRICAVLASLLIPLIWVPGVGIVILILAVAAGRLGGASDRSYSRGWLRLCIVDLVAGTIGALWTSVLLVLFATGQLWLY